MDFLKGWKEHLISGNIAVNLEKCWKWEEDLLGLSFLVFVSLIINLIEYKMSGNCWKKIRISFRKECSDFLQ